MLYKRLLGILMGVFMVLPSMAQDAIFSQFFAHKLYLNPAYAGFEPGVTFDLGYRRQWPKLSETRGDFVTQSLGVSIPMQKYQSGVGLQYIETRAGEGRLKMSRIGAVYAWNTYQCNDAGNRKWDLSLGMGVNYNFFQINQDQLTFSDQFHPLEGAIYTSSYSRATNFSSLENYMDFDAGALVSIYVGDKKDYLVGGLATHHIVRVGTGSPREDTLGMRWTMHLSYVLHTGNRSQYQIVPMIKLDSQHPHKFFALNKNSYWAIDYGVLFNTQALPSVFLGLWHRSIHLVPDLDDTNSLIIMAGMELGNGNRHDQSDYTYRFALSYDYNYSGLRSDGGGIWEVSLVVNLPDFKSLRCGSKKRLSKLPCPKF